MGKRAPAYDRETALEAAQDVFWRKGYHATSLKDLESALSMKPGSIYAAFQSKENLFLLTLERFYACGRADFAAAREAAPSALEALVGFLRRFGDTVPETPESRSCMLVKTVLDTTYEDATIATRAREYLDGMRALFAETFEEARARGEIPADADVAQLARRYQSDLSALRLETHRGGPREELRALAEDRARSYEALRTRNV